MTQYGIDVSHYQAITDGVAVARSGVSFAWCKATEGTDTDASFAGKVAQLRSAGVTVGAYHFLTDTDPVAQARHFAAVAGAAGCLAPGVLAPMLDVEDPAIRSYANGSITRWVDALAAGLVMVYANLDWWTRALVPDQWGNRSLAGVIARYDGQPGVPGWGGWSRLAVHQYSDTGSVPGIPGAVDRDATMPGWTLDRLRLPGTPAGNTAGPAAPAAPIDSTNTWVVRPGDTLGRIASAWGVTVAELAAVNGIPDPNLIYDNQVIHRPGTPHAAPAPVGADRYTVRPGDTLGAIAVREHTTVPVLTTLNHLANPNRITVNQILLLPGGAAPATGQRRYVVEAGDTLGTIAARLHVPGGWPTLQQINHLVNPNKITPKQVLYY